MTMQLNVRIEKQGAEPVLHCPSGIYPGDLVRVEGHCQFARYVWQLNQPLVGRVTRVMLRHRRIEIQYADLEGPSRYRLRQERRA
jgi:hypothetical protein